MGAGGWRAPTPVSLIRADLRHPYGKDRFLLPGRIDVPLETIRNWEQGKRSPTGAAQALLTVLDKAPEAALAA